MNGTVLVACRPLLVVGKGAAYAQADTSLTEFADASGIPFLSTALGRGVVPDSHAGCVQAARSLSLAKADVAIVIGARCCHCCSGGMHAEHGCRAWADVPSAPDAH